MRLQKDVWLAAVAAASLLVGAASTPIERGQHTPPSRYVLVTPIESVLGIPIHASFVSVIDRFNVVTRGKVLIEGDPYDFLVVRVADGVCVRIVFTRDSSDENSIAYSFEMDSNFIRDANGLGVGSTLGSIMDAWPNGQFVSGVLDDRFARYVTSQGIIFAFDPDDLPASCFDEQGTRCEPSDDIKVARIFVYAAPLAPAPTRPTGSTNM